jgi:hypothetical protein
MFHHRQASAKGEKRYSSYSFLTSELERGVVSITTRPRFTPRKRTDGTDWIAGWAENTGNIL